MICMGGGALTASLTNPACMACLQIRQLLFPGHPGVLGKPKQPSASAASSRASSVEPAAEGATPKGKAAAKDKQELEPGCRVFKVCHRCWCLQVGLPLLGRVGYG